MKVLKKIIVRIMKSNKYTKKLLSFLLMKYRKMNYDKFCKNNEIDEKMIIFESFMGRSYSDSGRAIYEEMIKDERFKDFTFVWSFKDPESKKDIEDLSRAVLVKHKSIPFFEYYSKAKYIVSNSRIDSIIQRREGQVYIQTWHGTPLKRLGYDILKGDNALHSQDEICKLYKLDAQRYTYLLSPSAFCSEKFSSAFNLPVNNPDVKIIEEGYPRNDFLSNFREEDVLNIKRKLGIENIDKKIILYAPTWRDNQHQNNVGYTYHLGVDFDKLMEELKEDYIILFRAHYFIANSFDFDKYDGFIYNVSHYENINDLYVTADLLITDYSSVFFDYSILKRPMIFYMYDLAEYQDQIRGFYISLDDLPGPIVESESDLVNVIKQDFSYDEKYRLFNEKFTSLEDGNAAKRVIEKCFHL